jgi:hypothetical protein
VRHTFVHDLESFFWVLVWMVATHVGPGMELNEEAHTLIDEMCDGNDQSLGNFKEVFILKPRVARKRILDLDNGWEDAGKVVSQFAQLLTENIYDKEGDQMDDSGSENPTDLESWHILKSVIDIFDWHIAHLKNL